MFQKMKDDIKCFLLFLKKYKRFFRFYKFSKLNIKETSFNQRNVENIDYFVIGSDQVWNQNEIILNKNLLGIDGKESSTFSYSASVGIDHVDSEYKDLYKNKLLNLKAISVREMQGKEIISKLTNRKDIAIVSDPTLLLTKNEWSSISKKPHCFDNSPYVLLYFLGDVQEKDMNQINKTAKELNLKVVNLMDSSKKYFTYGPKEFIYLIEHAEFVCTDSFHASVFSFIFDKSFIIFERDTKYMGNMLSRMTSFIEVYKLDDRLYNGSNITKTNLKHDYSNSYKILESERKKGIDYLLKSFKN